MNAIAADCQEKYQVSPIRSVPTEWDEKTLLDAVGMKKDLIVAGPFGSNLKVSDYRDEGIPIIRLQNIDYGKFIDKEIKYISPEKARELAYHSFRAGDLVLAKLGDPIGKTCIVPDYFQDGVVVADVVRIRVADGLADKNFIMYSLNSVATKNQLINGTIGSTRPRVNLDQIRDIHILVPPFNEQHKIAAILSSVDAAIEQTDAIIAQTERMKKSLMQELFTKGIGNTEFKETKIGSMPETWEFVTLGDVLSKVQYGLSKTGRPEGKYPIIRMNNLSRGHVDISSLQYVDLGEFEYQKYRIEKRDILFNRTNSFDLVGKTSIFNLDGNFVFASYIIRIVCRSERILPDYLNFYLNWDVSQGRLKDVATKGVSQSNINAKSLRKFSIFLPTIPEQLKIAAILSEFESKLCLEKLYRDRLSALKKGLMQNLLTGRVRVKVDGHA